MTFRFTSPLRGEVGSHRQMRDGRGDLACPRLLISTEKELYEALSLQFIEPELRESGDEIARGGLIECDTDSKACTANNSTWQFQSVLRQDQREFCRNYHRI